LAAAAVAHPAALGGVIGHPVVQQVLKAKWETYCEASYREKAFGYLLFMVALVCNLTFVTPAMQGEYGTWAGGCATVLNVYCSGVIVQVSLMHAHANSQEAITGENCWISLCKALPQDQWDGLFVLWQFAGWIHFAAWVVAWGKQSDPQSPLLTTTGAALAFITLLYAQFFMLVFRRTSVRIQIIYSMLQAVVQWIGIFLIFFIPFVVAFYILANSPAGASAAPLGAPPLSPPPQGGFSNLGRAAFSTFFILLNLPMGDEDQELYRAVGEDSYVLKACIHVLILIFGVLVLSNMVIAMLASCYQVSLP
jgi:hypothetical protein